jgi:hypothetical protein
MPHHLSRAHQAKPQPFLVDAVGLFEYMRFLRTVAKTEKWIGQYIRQSDVPYVALTTSDPTRTGTDRVVTSTGERECGVFWPGLSARMETWLGVSCVAAVQLSLFAIPFLADW